MRELAPPMEGQFASFGRAYSAQDKTLALSVPRRVQCPDGLRRMVTS